MSKRPGDLVREEVLAMSAYHVPPAAGLVKLDAMENPYGLPAELAAEMGARLAQVAVNRYPDPAYAGLKRRLRAALGIPSEEAYVAAYCRRRGLTGIGNWSFFLAFSFFRLAAICQGVYRRALDGNASNPGKAQIYGEIVKQLAGLAMEIIDNKT